MKVVILAGGRGTRLAEYTELIPKPMVEVGDRPIIWHIMKHYAHYGFKEFIIALGYKGEVIKHYFLDYHQLEGDISVSLGTNTVVKHTEPAEDWTAHLVDTGFETGTGGRLKRVRELIGDETFMMTYGDGVSNVNLPELLSFHEQHGNPATLTAVRPPARFGHMVFEGERVVTFSEKPQTVGGWINGGYFVLNPRIIDYIDGDLTPFESTTLDRLSGNGELFAYRHEGFWQCMDTVRDVYLLRRLWEEGRAPWKVW